MRGSVNGVSGFGGGFDGGERGGGVLSLVDSPGEFFDLESADSVLHFLLLELLLHPGQLGIFLPDLGLPHPDLFQLLFLLLDDFQLDFLLGIEEVDDFLSVLFVSVFCGFMVVTVLFFFSFVSFDFRDLFFELFVFFTEDFDHILLGDYVLLFFGLHLGDFAVLLSPDSELLH